jgi:hypothetical protein
MDCYFDTEFTNLDSINGYQMLISLGCVSEGGREFYHELSDTYHPGLCSTFVIDTVLPLLEGGSVKIMEAQLAVRFKEWIESLGDEEVVLRSDAPGTDWPFVAELCQFYVMWPKNLRRKCGSIGFDSDRKAFRYNAGLENYWALHSERRHHALVDARSLLYAYRYAMKKGE